MQKLTLMSLLGATAAVLIATAAFSSSTTYAADPSAPPEGAVPQAPAAEHREEPLELVFPLTITDCASPAMDCCNPYCKPNISGCCVATTCGLPKQATITGKGVWANTSVSCDAGAPTSR